MLRIIDDDYGKTNCITFGCWKETLHRVIKIYRLFFDLVNWTMLIGENHATLSYMMISPKKMNMIMRTSRLLEDGEKRKNIAHRCTSHIFQWTTAAGCYTYSYISIYLSRTVKSHKTEVISEKHIHWKVIFRQLFATNKLSVVGIYCTINFVHNFIFLFALVWLLKTLFFALGKKMERADLADIYVSYRLAIFFLVHSFDFSTWDSEKW